MTPPAGEPLDADRLGRRFEALIFDWDGTAVPDRDAEASDVRRAVEELCVLGMDVVVVSGTHVGNVDGQLAARPAGPGRLLLCLNRGSEVFLVGEQMPMLVHRREATAEEDAALTCSAEETVRRLAARGLEAKIVSQRLNRRKIDLIPEPEWADPPKARIGELFEAVRVRLASSGFASLGEVVRLAEEAARGAGLTAPCVTSDVKHVEIGLTDKSDSARWIFADLWRRGIAPAATLVGGDEFGELGGLPGSDSLMLIGEAEAATAVSFGVEPTGVPAGVIALGGGPAAFFALLEDQIGRRRRHEPPRACAAVGWTLHVESVGPTLARSQESLLTLADGVLGTRGSALGDGPAGQPSVLASGLYHDEGPETELLPCPLWNRLGVESARPEAARHCVLDLHSGLLWHEVENAQASLDALLFSSLARPGTTVLWASVPAAALVQAQALAPPSEGRPAETGARRGREWMRVRASQGGVVAAGRQKVVGGTERASLERIAAFHPDPVAAPPVAAALQRLRAAEGAGCERLLIEHRAAWAQRWDDADVVIEGDPDLQLAVRLALFHLMASVPDTGEAAVGARGLSGSAYRGHVFWDADVFVLPFLAATHPESARAMLEYRIRRLPAAREAARALGRAGARFPWESAASGRDVTPTHAYLRTGETVAIRTGQLEEHIVADVAWAAACYIDWTGDEEFTAGPGRDLIVETARYWASRIRLDTKGRGHIYGVIGPDEYHEPVDDNAYTNVMARWNLRRAAALDEVGGDERARWLELAEALIDGHDAATGLYEQFAGFFELEPLIISELAPRRPTTADGLLGHARVKDAQVVKQADVLLLHHLVPDEVVPGSLEPNLDFYEPRTAHGSSLSPGIHASLFARAGRLEQGLAWLRLASRIDLDDLTNTTGGGLHLATMGSVWQALAFGFVGVRPRGVGLQLDPRLPDDWRALELHLRFRGSRVGLRVDHASLALWADPAVTVSVIGLETERTVSPAGLLLRRAGSGWKETQT